MSREIYVPVFDSFFESSIMREELTVRFVMLALIRLAYRSRANGIVDVDPLIFAMSINLPPEDVERAIKRLMEPDPASTSPDEDGRRLVPVNPDRPFRGWRLVNWPKYRAMLHRINDAARKRDEYHATHGSPAASESLQESPETSKDLQTPPAASVFRATRRDETIRNETKKEGVRRFAPPTRAEVREFWTEKNLAGDPEDFCDHFENTGWKLSGGKGPVMRDWKLSAQKWSRTETRRTQPTLLKPTPAQPSAPQPIELRNGRYRLPSGWWASEDGSTIEKNFETYERRPGSSGLRYIHESHEDGVAFYVTGQSIATTSYDESIRRRERDILRGHPRFPELFPETKA